MLKLLVSKRKVILLRTKKLTKKLSEEIKRKILDQIEITNDNVNEKIKVKPKDLVP